jgi:hypothetical protein
MSCAPRPPEVAILDLSAKRRDPPVGGITGDHIHVIEKDDGPVGFSGRVRKPRPQVAASGRVFKHAGFQFLRDREWVL